MRGVTRSLFRGLANSEGLETLASRYGMHPDRGFARPFVAGETAADAIAVARRLAASGLTATLECLDRNATTMAEADRASRAYLAILHEIAVSPIERHVSLALTRFGLLVDRATCVDNLRRVLDVASTHGFVVHIGMDDARYTQVTFDVFDTLWQQDYRATGIVVPAALRRSLEDVRRLNRMGARVRLVKGAFRERRAVAYRSTAEIDAAFLALMRLLLLDGTAPAIATHDPALIDETRTFASTHGIASDRFEFQMFYGIREDLQASLAASGSRVRICVPFGRAWFPYLMRRLGEHPASIPLVLRRALGPHRRGPS